MKTMKIFKTTLLLWIAVFVLSGCAGRAAFNQATQSYQSGDYEGAVRSAVQALKEKPDYKEATTLLKDSAPKAFEKRKSIAESCEAEGKWDDAVSEYDRLSDLQDLVTTVNKDIPSIDIAKAHQAARNNAAEDHYQKAVRLMDSGMVEQAIDEFKQSQAFVPDYKDSDKNISKGKEVAAESHYKEADELFENKRYRESVVEFRKAVDFVPGYRDASARLSKAKELATINVLVLPMSFEVKGLTSDESNKYKNQLCVKMS